MKTKNDEYAELSSEEVWNEIKKLYQDRTLLNPMNAVCSPFINITTSPCPITTCGDCNVNCGNVTCGKINVGNLTS